jgi:hypothetical protein
MLEIESLATEKVSPDDDRGGVSSPELVDECVPDLERDTGTGRSVQACSQMSVVQVFRPCFDAIRALRWIRKWGLLVVPRQGGSGGSRASVSVGRGCPGGDRRRPCSRSLARSTSS